MLSNAYLLANFRFDTAENKPAKNGKISVFFNSKYFFQAVEEASLLARIENRGFLKKPLFSLLPMLIIIRYLVFVVTFHSDQSDWPGQTGRQTFLGEMPAEQGDRKQGQADIPM